ncbi:MAG TPA: carboxypeptidase-like regulatory domain-containing protein [Gemmatimonadaceae bacterium]|nr:carboxypeptidase-like regulatory domain-containing protein [Gemmatimonadaceae bacterium]
MKVLIALPLLALWLAPAELESQEETRADVLSGRVTDLTGRPIVDAQVGATALGSGITRSISTDAEGRYRLFFPRTARQYVLLVKRLGFAPLQRTITRRTNRPEEMTIDVQLGGTPLALSLVEITGESDALPTRQTKSRPGVDATVPNPVAEILALKDTLHLSAVQIAGLTDVADSLRTKNTRIYTNIRTLLAKSQEAGNAGQMAGSVALMLDEASDNTARAVTAAEKLLRPEQWQVLPQVIKDLLQNTSADATKQ